MGEAVLYVRIGTAQPVSAASTNTAGREIAERFKTPLIVSLEFFHGKKAAFKRLADLTGDFAPKPARKP